MANQIKTFVRAKLKGNKKIRLHRNHRSKKSRHPRYYKEGKVTRYRKLRQEDDKTMNQLKKDKALLKNKTWKI